MNIFIFRDVARSEATDQTLLISSEGLVDVKSGEVVMNGDFSAVALTPDGRSVFVATAPQKETSHMRGSKSSPGSAERRDY